MKPLVQLLKLTLMLGCLACTSLAVEPKIRFVAEEQQVRVYIGDQEVFDYVFVDSKISRPYFAHVKTLTGSQVSRNHPPREGLDKTDHDTFHPGIWLSFGDINGHDYWRLKARTKHIRFLEPPVVETDVGKFKVLNHYLATNSDAVVCTEECSIRVKKVDTGYRIAIASEFKSADDLRFGDQEEMGLGIRVATPLAVESKLGGRILDSEGRINGKEVWGKAAVWCDYSGTLDGKWVGMTMLTSPKNFRPCWSHARDYGFLAMNPFGLNAFTKTAKKDIVAKHGESLHLGYAIVVHESAQESDYNAKIVYDQYSAQE